jgi:hypothetical protein
MIHVIAFTQVARRRTSWAADFDIFLWVRSTNGNCSIEVLKSSTKLYALGASSSRMNKERKTAYIDAVNKHKNAQYKKIKAVKRKL